MKKLLVIGLLFVSVVISAQKVQPGIRTGTNLSKIYGIKGDVKADFYIGGILALNLGRIYTLQPEIGYSNQGGSKIYKREKMNDTEYKDTYKNLDLQYVSLALTNKFYITPYRNLNISLTPGIDVLVADNFGSEEKISESGFVYTNNVSQNITGADLNMSFGLGYEHWSGFGVEARYKMGVVDVFHDYNVRGSAQNRVFQIGLIYKFFNKKCKKQCPKLCDHKSCKK